MQAAEHTRRGSQEPSQKTLVLAFTAGGVLAAATIILLVFAGATPFQCFAIPIVFATFVISLWMAARWRQWRALPVCGVAALVLARLTIDLAAHCGVIPPGHLVQWIREVLAWTAVPAAFAAIAYLWRIFENQARFVEAQKALQENARQYRHLVQNATDAVYTANVDGTFTLVNAGVAKLFGRRAADLNAMSFFDLVSGDVRTVMEEALQRQTSQDVRAFYHEFCVTRRDGPPVWVGQNLQAVIEHPNRRLLRGLDG